MVRGRLLALAVAAALLAQPAIAASLTEAQVRRFVAGQEAAWNAGRLDAYYATFTADAVFVEQTKTPKETIVYGRSSLAKATQVSRRALAKSTLHDRTAIQRVTLGADGRSAQVQGSKVTTITTGRKVRTVCAGTVQALVLQRGRILSKGQTDNIVRCRAGTR
jgi:hypothetical protein